MDRHHSFQTPLTARIALTTIIWILVILMVTGCSSIPGFSPKAGQVAVKPAPEAVGQQSDAGVKKQEFFAKMKPLVIAQNRRIALQRDQLLKLKSSMWLNKRDLAAIHKIADEYEVEIASDKPSEAQWQQMLARVDVVPLEMALVQAANESAWGSSRFAQQGNNYFGQWCYQKGCGIVPNARSDGASHEVKRFASAAESVAAYMHNINTTRAYGEFRTLRASQRIQNQPLDAVQLALGLKSYSERGMDYVKTIQAMIRSNRALIEQS